jgi:uncharacterized repeat protein (TIGR03803 family)
MKTNNAFSNHARVNMDLLLPGTMRMPMNTTKAIFGVLKVTLGRTGRICTSSFVPLLSLLLILPVLGAQAAVVFTSLYSFTGTNDGASPNGLVQGSDGYFYGTTSGGGEYTNQYSCWGQGTVFKISTNGAFTSLYSFGSVQDTNGVPLDGAFPQAGLVQGSDGYFYGTTSGGGAQGWGTVFKISANGVLTTLYAFGAITNASGWLLDGAFPQAGLVQGSDGNLYGTTFDGGAGTSLGYPANGTLFKISTNGALTTFYLFTGGNDGASPTGLVQGSDGYFYGTTAHGGTTHYNPMSGGPSYGTVFKISTTGALTTLYAFGDSTNAWGGLLLKGTNPNGLVQGSDGNFYGTTQGTIWVPNFGGFGTVFKISTTGAFTSLYSFGSVQDTNGVPLDGADPSGALVQGSDGNLYGTTSNYGIGGSGTVFKISANGALTTLYSFTGGAPYVGSYAALVQGRDGSFYGTTECGGTTNLNLQTWGLGYGTVFRLTIVPQPQLTIIPSGPYVILTWPTNYSGFSCGGYTLQSTTDLGSSAVWSTNSSPPVVIGGENVVINTMSGKQKFYRLSQ